MTRHYRAQAATLMATPPAAADSDGPRAQTRAAPPASPARAPPPSKKKKGAKTDALALAMPGEEFDVVVEVDVTVYGVAIVTVRMIKDVTTGLSRCLTPCKNPAWCNHASTNAMFQAVLHVKAFHMPDKIGVVLKTTADGAEVLEEKGRAASA